MDRRRPRPPQTRLRARMLAVVAIGCFAALFARLWYLQVLLGPELGEQARAHAFRTVSVEGPRGRILDSAGRVLVGNRPSLDVAVVRADYAALDDPAGFRADLAAALTSLGVETTAADIEGDLADTVELEAATVATDVEELVWLYLAEHAASLPAVRVDQTWERSYAPELAGVGGNVLGYVAPISEEAFAAEGAEPSPVGPDGTPKAYTARSMVGVAGVEAAYEDELRGVPGEMVLEVDASGRVVRRVSSTPPRPGSDVQLTIDFAVQAEAERALDAALAEVRGGVQRDDTGVEALEAPAGALVLTDPESGAVRALATAPRYDPAAFVGGISQARYDELTSAGGVSALVDRSISGRYAPGSTFKLVTASAALDAGLIGPSTTYVDAGSYRVGDRSFGNAGGAVYGSLDVSRALTVSSDVFFYWLGEQSYGSTVIQDTARAHGFARPTGIDLPHEAAGQVLTPDELRRAHEDDPAVFPDPEWYVGRSVNLAIGQQVVLVTPLQLATAYGAFANGGTVWRPHVVAAVLDPDPAGGDPVARPVEPEATSSASLDPADRAAVHEGLAGVARRGTAATPFRGFDLDAVPLVAKTGTAQVDGKADTALFAGSTETTPGYAFAAVLEESGFGSAAAAPAVRQVLESLYGPASPAEAAPGSAPG